LVKFIKEKFLRNFEKLFESKKSTWLVTLTFELTLFALLVLTKVNNNATLEEARSKINIMLVINKVPILWEETSNFFFKSVIFKVKI
jgi:hypothetical protein